MLKLISLWRDYESLKTSVLALYTEGVEMAEIANRLKLARGIVEWILKTSKGE